MNIYKKLYTPLKKRLYDFGKVLNRMEYSDDYWFNVYSDFTNTCEKNEWWILFCEYLLFCCDEQERMFIDLYLFKKKSLVNVSMIIPLSERACQEWREEIFKNLIGLAMQCGLININVATIKDAFLEGKNDVE